VCPPVENAAETRKELWVSDKTARITITAHTRVFPSETDATVRARLLALCEEEIDAALAQWREKAESEQKNKELDTMPTTIAPPPADGNRGVTVDEARYRLGNMGKTLFYDLVKQGKIRVVKLGNRTVVPMSEIDRLLNGEGDSG
jgi:hypothetical protein